MNKVLIISTEYPPAARSSGVQRILSFVKYLPQYQWLPSVLTMHQRAYGLKQINSAPLNNSNIDVKRATAFNTAIHFSIKGRYLSWMALPDRWSSWVVFGFFSGLSLIKKNKPTVIFSSYPHASSHLLALLLHKATKIPLVADFRDPMLYLNESVTGVRYKLYQWIEKSIIQSCQFATFTTPSAINQYIKLKYPKENADKFYLIENGFDEDSFKQAENQLMAQAQIKNNKIVLLHSGGIFEQERNPSYLFTAIARLLKTEVISEDDFKLILRSPGDEKYCQDKIDALNLQHIITVEPKLAYQEALMEMLSVDGLLVLQDTCCNFQIPAKIYEYFRANKPILALTDHDGETANLLKRVGHKNIAPLNDCSAIAHELTVFISTIRTSEQRLVNKSYAKQFSRQHGAKKLADIFSLVVDK